MAPALGSQKTAEEAGLRGRQERTWHEPICNSFPHGTFGPGIREGEQQGIRSVNTGGTQGPLLHTSLGLPGASFKPTDSLPSQGTVTAAWGSRGQRRERPRPRGEASPALRESEFAAPLGLSGEFQKPTLGRPLTESLFISLASGTGKCTQAKIS